VQTLLIQIKEGFDQDYSVKNPDPKEQCMTKDLVLLDDVGSERPTEWAVSELGDIINSRYDSDLPTIITTNTPIDKLKDYLSERIASRLAEMCLVIPMVGPDLRLVSG
jgi:DNA replication protein DnaC